MRIGIGTVAAVSLLGLGLVAGPAQARANPACYANHNGTLQCGNTAPTPIYSTSNSDNPRIHQVDTLRSNPSWFKCWIRGSRHSGGNNIWYYTYGDDSHRWGYVPAGKVFTPKDPMPGVNHC
ncbi:MAG: hypothetical protein HOY71_56465 [Nonomuraea sp.]|nr:hypothetical protein [Nonomuraea sp.]